MTVARRRYTHMSSCIVNIATSLESVGYHRASDQACLILLKASILSIASFTWISSRYINSEARSAYTYCITLAAVCFQHIQSMSCAKPFCFDFILLEYLPVDLKTMHIYLHDTHLNSRLLNSSVDSAADARGIRPRISGAPPLYSCLTPPSAMMSVSRVTHCNQVW